MDAAKVAVIGAGSWGTTLAALLARNTPQGLDRKVALWARDPLQARAMSAERCNQRYMPSLTFPDGLSVTSDIGEAVTGAELLVAAVPTRWTEGVLTTAAPMVGQGAVVVNVAKGIEPQRLLTMSELIQEVLPGRATAVLTGPNLAPEIAAGLPAAAVVACTDGTVAAGLQLTFSFPNLRIYTNDDVIGCEVAGAVKNVLALGAGMADGLCAGHNAKAAIVTRGLAELARLGAAMGGHPWTFSGLAGLGDIVLTCTSGKSRNWSVGYRLGQGLDLVQATADMHQVAEGLTAAPSVVALAARYGTEMPICEQVASVIVGKRKPAEALLCLLERDQVHERAGLPTVAATGPLDGRSGDRPT